MELNHGRDGPAGRNDSAERITGVDTFASKMRCPLKPEMRDPPRSAGMCPTARIVFEAARRPATGRRRGGGGRFLR